MRLNSLWIFRTVILSIDFEVRQQEAVSSRACNMSINWYPVQYMLETSETGEAGGAVEKYQTDVKGLERLTLIKVPLNLHERYDALRVP